MPSPTTSSATQDSPKSGYEQYVSSHYAHIRDISLLGLKRQLGLYDSHFADVLPHDRQASILDVGCGFGSFMYYLAHRGYSNVIGIDASKQQVHTAIKLGIANVLQADASEFLAEARECSYECIFMIDVVEHWTKDDAMRALTLAHRALRPSGRLIIQLPNGASPFVGTLLLGDFTHQFALTTSSARQLLTLCGFDSIEMRSVYPHAHGFISCVRRTILALGDAMLKLYLAAQTGVARGHIVTPNIRIVATKVGE